MKAVFWQSMPSSQPVPSERTLIESIRERTEVSSSSRRSASLFHSKLHSKSSERVTLGIGDDCAILTPPRGHEILVTTDFSVESIHFRREWQAPESVGHRCLARGLSDLAAMGAQPLAAFLSLALPAELVRSRLGKPSWRDRFFGGFLTLADRYNVPLAGGDTAQSPRTPENSTDRHSTGQQIGGKITGWALADIILVGSAPRNRALLRSGAKACDRIYVTGNLGGAAAELAQLAASPRRFRAITPGETAEPNRHPHLFPEPRLAVGAWLLKNRRATAAIDISDGLSTDLDHLCEESGVSATIDAAAIPIHPLAQDLGSAEKLELALNGGEDYELLFTASPDMHIPRRIAGVRITCIGEMRRYRSGAPRVLLIDALSGKRRERPLPPGGWEHYK